MDNRKIASELVKIAKDLVAADVTEKDLKRMADLTDKNNHIEALIYLYENVLKINKVVYALKNIRELQNYFGYMPRELEKLVRDSFYTPAIKEVRSKFDKETADKIYYCF